MKNIDWKLVGMISLVVWGLIFIAACILLEVYVFATYGDKPINEIPVWALWLMFSNN